MPGGTFALLSMVTSRSPFVNGAFSTALCSVEPTYRLCTNSTMREHKSSYNKDLRGLAKYQKKFLTLSSERRATGCRTEVLVLKSARSWGPALSCRPFAQPYEVGPFSTQRSTKPQMKINDSNPGPHVYDLDMLNCSFTHYCRTKEHCFILLHSSTSSAMVSWSYGVRKLAGQSSNLRPTSSAQGCRDRCQRRSCARFKQSFQHAARISEFAT